MIKLLMTAALLIATPALADAAEPSGPTPEIEHTLTLTNADLQFMSWFMGLYAGKGCSITDEGAALCHAVDPARALAKKIDDQLRAEKTARVKPTK